VLAEVGPRSGGDKDGEWDAAAVRAATGEFPGEKGDRGRRRAATSGRVDVVSEPVEERQNTEEADGERARPGPMVVAGG
jgi:hypothetical protein